MGASINQAGILSIVCAGEEYNGLGKEQIFRLKA